MKIISPAILIAALSASRIHAETHQKDHHKQTYGQQSTGGLRKLNRNETRTHIPAESRIVGGSDADVGEYPFFVDWNGECGASLIHKDIIISAAHCAGIVSNIVHVGSSRKLGSGVAGGSGEQRSITQRVPHPSYDPNTVNYDYLVMKLDSPVDIKPVVLNEDVNSPINEQAVTVIGYGTTAEVGFGTSILQEVEVNYIQPDTCSVDYSGGINEATMMCAGVGGGKDSCQGDSGGPLFTRSGDTFTQVGIVSWGYGCARPEFPGVYSRVSGEIDWIKTQICNLSSDPPDYCDQLGEGKVSVRLDITYDDYPNEIGWSVKLGQGTITGKSAGFISTPNTFVQERFNLDPGTYDFVISDTFGDGFCCGFGDGNYKIYAEVPGGDDMLLVESNGQFESSETKTLVVPAPTPQIPSPTPPAPSPTLPVPQPNPPDPDTLPPLNKCADTDDTFSVDDTVGSRDCTWLGNNQLRFGYLCKFINVAAACKVTCDACEYFQPLES